MVEVKEPNATVEDVMTLARLCHNIKNPQAKIVPTSKKATKPKPGCCNIEV
ncbi:hypothetical protein J1N35_001658 [Gossypium stocksii]|uniref:Uncharacterized protein n=1 Tax=Gossypium stocksii TaxID=47602 RepID=A0A9D3WKB4_9ROSI|nr:hypothetical protein J1N35_001658 [Gossypium stocksii]